MEDQSPYVSSSNAERHSPVPEEQPHHGTGEPHHGTGEPHPDHWKVLEDVLDLTAGQYSHPAFSVSFPDKKEEEEEDKQPSYSDSLEPSPEEEEPSSIGSDVPRAQVIPSAPAEEHDTAAAPYKPPSSGSVDVNLFPLSAASAPLMHSFADNVMDFQQPSRIEPAGKEDFSSVLLESTASLPSLSAGYTAAFSVDSTSPSALQGYDTETDYTESKLHKFTSGLGELNEDTIFSERGFTVQHPTSDPESVPGDHAKLYTQSAKEMFSGMLKSVGPPHEEFTDLKEVADEHYVDFKPFASTMGHDFGFEVKDAPPDFKSDIGHLIFESGKSSEIYSEEKDIDISDDISPASPEAISDYETFPALQQSAPLAYGGNPFTDHKFDQKRLEQVETRPTSHLGSNVATVNPFLEHMDQQLDYVSTDSTSGIVTAQVSSKPEGLTPDIVQEAYESEVHEVGVPKLNYEPKIDLVQTTAKAAQENVSPVAQNTALFEDSDSVSSPVLPDIVMEAPLTSAPVGLNAVASQPDVSPVGQRKLDSEEKIKSYSEKPPSYDDAVKKVNLQEQQPVVCVEQGKRARGEETEAPYISIACDLIKETIPEKVTDFSKALASEFDSPYAVDYDESSPESEPSEPSYKHWESEVISKVAAPAVGSVKSHDVTLEKEKESDLKGKEQVPSKGYLESEAYISDKVSLAKEPVTQSSNQEKPLQMEAFGRIYSEEVPQVKPPVHFEKSFPVPTIDEFASKPSRDDRAEVKETKPRDDHVQKPEPKKTEEAHKQQKAKESDHASDKLLDLSKAGTVFEETVSKPKPPAKSAEITSSTSTEKKQPSAPPCLGVCSFKTSVVDLLYWRDIKKSGAVFGASLFLLLSLTVFSIVSVTAYIALALLSVSISLRIYKGVLQAIQKSDEGHPFKQYLDTDVSVSEDLVKKYCNVALGHINRTAKELRRLFLVEDLVDSLKFAVLMWVFTYIGALFNGLTLLILALISLFSIPVVYERHQTQVDHYLGLISKNVNNIKELILSKVPGLKRKAE
ncbi:reticulon-4 isoform X1 [Hyperolius riggenbachi]|uniref:reticulon-4 isoform X1 n=1 Tax=Hyperolius riggenbachi TaxID=752182 RepID=UPI0035A37742